VGPPRRLNRETLNESYRFGNHVRERIHPVLGELDVAPYDTAPEDRAPIACLGVSNASEHT